MSIQLDPSTFTNSPFPFRRESSSNGNKLLIDGDLRALARAMPGQRRFLEVVRTIWYADKEGAEKFFAMVCVSFV